MPASPGSSSSAQLAIENVGASGSAASSSGNPQVHPIHGASHAQPPPGAAGLAGRSRQQQKQNQQQARQSQNQQQQQVPQGVLPSWMEEEALGGARSDIWDGDNSFRGLEDSDVAYATSQGAFAPPPGLNPRYAGPGAFPGMRPPPMAPDSGAMQAYMGGPQGPGSLPPGYWQSCQGYGEAATAPLGNAAWGPPGYPAGSPPQVDKRGMVGCGGVQRVTGLPGTGGKWNYPGKGNMGGQMQNWPGGGRGKGPMQPNQQMPPYRGVGGGQDPNWMDGLDLEYSSY